ncbi:MAG: serine/threonine-protein kinase [Burkholderiales bacterium]
MATAKLTRLGRYKVLGELGRGAMGIVYKAHDPVLDRTVALKTIILTDDASGRTEYEARFFQEAKAAGRLNHPAIIAIYDFGEEGDLAYMAMEMVEGTELRARMSQGAIPVRHAIDIAEQAADGLAFAHERGVVHRDIKPGNIMLMPRGRVKIMDFGIARVRISEFKTQTGTKLGTPKYMSPEQVIGRPVDHRSDIFSLGIVLYEMLTHSSLFRGSNTSEVLYNVANVQQVPPSRLNAEVPSTLDLIVKRALEKNPGARYQDTYEFASDLRACLDELGGREAAENVGFMDTLVLDAPVAIAGHGEDAEKTVRLDAAMATENTLPLAPPASANGSGTGLAFSPRFDSSAALRRLSAPAKRDRALLARAPRPLGVLRRLRHDRDLRQLAAVVVAAALIGGAVAFF